MTKSEWEVLTKGWDGAAGDGEAAGLLRALLNGQNSQSSATEVTRVVVQPGVESLVPNMPPVSQAADPAAALELQLCVRSDFEAALAKGLRAEAFRRDEVAPAYLMFKS